MIIIQQGELVLTDRILTGDLLIDGDKIVAIDEHVPVPEGAKVIDALINCHSISQVDGLFCGNVVGTGGNIGRLMGLMCNLSTLLLLRMDPFVKG